MRNCITSLLLAAGLLSAAQGASITYLSNSGVTDLSDGAAWDGGVAPGPDDVAVFDGTLPDTLTIPANAAWLGLVRTNIENAVTFDGGPLTLGTDGITCFTTNNTYYRTTLPSVVLSAAQTWTLAENKTLAASGSITGTGPLTITAPSGWNMLFYGNVEPTGGVLARGQVFFWAMQGARFAQPPDMVHGTRFLLLADGTGTWSYSDLMASPFVNNGMFSFGSKDGDTANAAAVSPTVTLAAGDSIGGTDAANADRSKQQFHVQDTHVVVDGADLTGNSWFFLRSGSWTQLSGDVGLNYAAIVGRGASDGYKSKLQRLTLSGGTFTARRLCVGVANSDLYPAEVFVTGGEYVPTFPNDSAWTCGITVGQRAAKGETVWDAASHKDVPMNGEYASGRFEMTGGTVKTASLFFGNSATPRRERHPSGGLLELQFGVALRLRPLRWHARVLCERGERHGEHSSLRPRRRHLILFSQRHHDRSTVRAVSARSAPARCASRAPTTTRAARTWWKVRSTRASTRQLAWTPSGMRTNSSTSTRARRSRAGRTAPAPQTRSGISRTPARSTRLGARGTLCRPSPPRT